MQKSVACLIWAIAAAIALSGCVQNPSESSKQQHKQAIYHGERELGEPWVVAVTYIRPGTTRLRLCTGSLIASQAVLTAKHCIFDEAEEGVWTALAPSEFTVSVTDDIQASAGPDEAVGVTQIWTTPDVYETGQALGGQDIAVLMLDAPLAAEPVAYARHAPSEGASIQITGFGFTEDDTLGEKFTGQATIRAFDEGVFESEGESWTCVGDSGGPALDVETGTILGVTSIGPSGCRVDDSYYTRVDRYAPMIDAFLGVEPPCEPSPETCNNEDDDCNGIVDDGCTDGNTTCENGVGDGCQASEPDMGVQSEVDSSNDMMVNAPENASSDEGCATLPRSQAPKGGFWGVMLLSLGLFWAKRRA